MPDKNLAGELYLLGKRKMMLCDVDGFADAVPLFLQALEVSPNDPVIYAAMAETYSYWGRRREINGQECLSYYNLAYDNARRSLELGPDSSEAHRAMAVALRGGELCDPETRQREAARAYELNDYDAENCCEYWRTHGRRPDDPLIYKTVVLEPLLCGAHNDLGVALCEHERLDEAAFHLEAAVDLNPRNSLFQYNLAMVYFRRGAACDAQRLLEMTADLHPGDPLVLSGLQLIASETREAVLAS